VPIPDIAVNAFCQRLFQSEQFRIQRRMDKPLCPISEIRKAMSADVLEESSSYLAGTLRRLYSLVIFGSFWQP
jgi:hypothetical protein